MPRRCSVVDQCTVAVREDRKKAPHSNPRAASKQRSTQPWNCAYSVAVFVEAKRALRSASLVSRTAPSSSSTASGFRLRALYASWRRFCGPRASCAGAWSLSVLAGSLVGRLLVAAICGGVAALARSDARACRRGSRGHGGLTALRRRLARTKSALA